MFKQFKIFLYEQFQIFSEIFRQQNYSISESRYRLKKIKIINFIILTRKNLKMKSFTITFFSLYNNLLIFKEKFHKEVNFKESIFLDPRPGSILRSIIKKIKYMTLSIHYLQ